MKKIQKQFIIGATLLASTGIVSTVNADTTPVEVKHFLLKIIKLLLLKKRLNNKLNLSPKLKKI